MILKNWKSKNSFCLSGSSAEVWTRSSGILCPMSSYWQDWVALL